MNTQEFCSCYRLKGANGCPFHDKYSLPKPYLWRPVTFGVPLLKGVPFCPFCDKPGTETNHCEHYKGERNGRAIFSGTERDE